MKKWKWALLEVVNGKQQNLLAIGNKKLVKVRFKGEKKRTVAPGRTLLLMKLWKQWPKKVKAVREAA